jgi:archaeosine-15-forming tRNA-guanine transglycosylase
MVDKYNSIMEYINKGYKVLTKYVDRIDEEFQEFINEAIDGENVILVSKKAD